jgi:Tfp pilus assembly protein PilF
MGNIIPTVDEVLPVPQAIHLDQVCDRFESVWKGTASGQEGPRIEDYLTDTPEPERSRLLHQLILLDVDYRQLRGQQPAAEEYKGRFPSLSAPFLAEAFPSLSAVEAGDVLQVQTTVLPPSFAPKLRSDRYIIGEFHARGGIGEIWAAVDAEIGRQVALKRLRKKREEQQDRFLVEAQITGQLEHPGIVPVHDLGVDEEGRPFYVMTFIHGRTLKEVIDEAHANHRAGGKPQEVLRCRLLEIFVKVCQTVAYAHHRGVIHRDLKPDNVMLGPYGETLVLDWGMAKLRSVPEQPGNHPPVQLTYASGSLETRAGVVMGSPSYMAPEVAGGHAAEADERTDVYLLGATLYHILTGHAPRDGRSHEEIIELARNVVPPPPRQLKADVPRALEAICLKAMARTPEGRYASALELTEDVQCYLAEAPVAAYPEPPLARAWRWCKRHRRALARSVAAAAVLGVLLLGAVLVGDASKRAAESQREARELQQREKVRDDLREFQRRADERQFYAASTTPAGDQSFQYDARTAQVAGEQALALADELDKELEQVDLPREKSTFHQQWHDLLLLSVQAQAQQKLSPKEVEGMLQRLERAVSLRKASRGYYRLQSQCYQLLRDTRQRDEAARRAEDKDLRPTALDHFLLAEQARAQSASPSTGNGDSTTWEPNPDRLKEAIEHYQAALLLEPGDYWSNFQMGRCYLSLGAYDRAELALGNAIALRPNLPWGYTARGLVLGLSERYADAEADLERALKLEKDFRPALLHRGFLAMRQGKTEQALADFKEVLEPPAERRLIVAAYYRGALFMKLRKFGEALEDFARVAREDPTFRDVYLLRAQLHLQRDDLEWLSDLNKYLKLGMPADAEPKEPVLSALRGRLLQQLVESEKLPRDALGQAQAQLKRAIERGNGSAEVFDSLGLVLENLGKPTEALNAYTSALAAAPPPRLKAKILSKRGWIFVQLSPPQLDKAREAFAAMLDLKPSPVDAVDARAGLGYVAALGKSGTEAQREVAYALLNGRGDYMALHNLACTYMQLSQQERPQAKEHQDMALALLRRAVELARRGGRGPEEIKAIQGDPDLKPLEKRQEFKELLRQ